MPEDFGTGAQQGESYAEKGLKNLEESVRKPLREEGVSEDFGMGAKPGESFVEKQNLTTQAADILNESAQVREAQELTLDFGTGAPSGESYVEKLQQYSETPQQYDARIKNAQKTWNRPIAAQIESREQGRAQLPEEEQTTLTDIGQEMSETSQAAAEKAQRLAKAALEADLILSDDLSELSLNPDKYQESVDSAIKTGTEILGDAAVERQKEDLPLDFGMGN